MNLPRRLILDQKEVLAFSAPHAEYQESVGVCIMTAKDLPRVDLLGLHNFLDDRRAQALAPFQMAAAHRVHGGPSEERSRQAAPHQAGGTAGPFRCGRGGVAAHEKEKVQCLATTDTDTSYILFSRRFLLSHAFVYPHTHNFNHFLRLN